MSVVIMAVTAIIAASTFEVSVELTVGSFLVAVKLTVDLSPIMTVLMAVFIVRRSDRREEEQPCQRKNGKKSFFYCGPHNKPPFCGIPLANSNTQPAERFRSSIAHNSRSVDRDQVSWLQRRES